MELKKFHLKSSINRDKHKHTQKNSQYHFIFSVADISDISQYNDNNKTNKNKKNHAKSDHVN